MQATPTRVHVGWHISDIPFQSLVQVVAPLSMSGDVNAIRVPETVTVDATPESKKGRKQSVEVPWPVQW